VHLGRRCPGGVNAKSSNGHGGSQRARPVPWTRSSRARGALREAAAEGALVALGRPPARGRCYTPDAPPPVSDAALSAPPSWAASIDGEHSHQAHVPAEEALSPEDPRLSDPDVLARGAAGDQGAAPEGPQAADARARPVSVAVERGHRLRGAGAFAAVRDRRASAVSGPLRVQVAPNGRGIARVGFVVPRSVGGAVVRNRVRRRLRALMRARLDAHAGLDVVVAARGGAATEAWASLERALESCLAAARGRLGGGDPGAAESVAMHRGGAPEGALRDNRGVRVARTGRDDPTGGRRPAST
jgi:ribonuclease P protein component